MILYSKGKRHEQIVTGSKADADAAEARLRLELDAGGLSRRVAPTFFDFCKDEYRPFAETNLKPSTWKKVRVYQVATLAEFFGGMKLTKITTAEVERFKAARLRAGMLPSSVNNEVRVLRTILGWARDAGFPVSVPKVRRLPPRGKPRVQTWTTEELGRLFAEARAESPELLRLLVFLANTGCRKGEGIAAEWSWIDLDAGMVRIPSNAVWQPKNGEPREVPISDSCRAILAGPRASDRWVFPKGIQGKRYLEFPKDAFWAARDRAKLTGGPHVLRHTFASFFLQAVPDMFLLGKVLGHSTQRVTDLYSHLLPEHLARARNAVNLGPSLISVAAPLADATEKPTTAQKTSSIVNQRH